MTVNPPGTASPPSTVPATRAVSGDLPSVTPSSGGGQALGRLSTRGLAAPQGGAQAKVASVPQVAPKAKAVLPEGTPKEQYDYALDLLRVGKFDEAEKALAAFVAVHSQETLTENAEYWLGETYYVRRDYRTAVRIFAKSYQNHKDGAKASDSLLKLGMSLGNLKKTREACLIFDKLEKDFPNVPGHVKSTIERQRKSVGCN
jgi:tol-pal system protein YbgF